MARIIEGALSRRNTRQRDLSAGVLIDDFLEQTSWIKGIVPLFRPAGFAISGEFRRQVQGPEAPPPTEEPTEPFEDGPDLGPAEEVRWALLLLGLGADATRAQIQSAYRALAKQVHPDSHREDSKRQEAEEQMKDLNLAYEILRSRRAQR